MAALDGGLGPAHTGSIAHFNRLLTVALCLSAVADVRRFAGVHHVPFGIALDRKGKVRRAYALRGVPTSTGPGSEHERSDHMQQTLARGRLHSLGRVALALGVLVAFLPKQAFGQG